jgi:hypothetical protein
VDYQESASTTTCSTKFQCSPNIFPTKVWRGESHDMVDMATSNAGAIAARLFAIFITRLLIDIMSNLGGVFDGKRKHDYRACEKEGNWILMIRHN